MKQLTLIRHAKSSWNDASLRDFDRPLNARGSRDAPVMAKRFAAAATQPLRLVSSPALRAISTAQQFAEALGGIAIHLDPIIYEATPGTLLHLVNGLADADSHVVLFGHNPGFTELARLLADEPLPELPTCAVVTLGFADVRWATIVPDSGELMAFCYPKDDY